VRDILSISARAASGGNVQPWKIYGAFSISAAVAVWKFERNDLDDVLVVCPALLWFCRCVVLGPEKRNELVDMVADKMANRKPEKPQYDICA
jgi:hypothetical protein